MRRSVSLLIVASTFLTGCAGGSDYASTDTPWVTAIDSTGDTIIVRIAGEIPDRLVRTLVPELRVGSLDGGEETTFGNILAVRPAAGGGLVVYDQQATAVRLFDAQGAFVRNVAVNGGGPGEFGHLNGITSLPDGRWVLWDAAGSRLNFHAADGRFERSVMISVGRTNGQGMLFSDASGRLYVDAVVERDSVDFSRSKRGLIALDTAGTALDTLRFPEWGDPPSTVQAMTPDRGAASTWYVPFIPASTTQLLRSGGRVSGPSDPYRFYLLPSDGSRPTRIEREHVPAAVVADEREYWSTAIETAMRRLDPKWRWNGPQIPANKPAYRDFDIGLDGRIWVQVSTMAEPIPAAELTPLEPGQAPSARRSTRAPAVYDVYSPAGALLGRVKLPWNTSISATRGNVAWGTMTDSLDIPYAVRFRIEPPLPERP